mmetsp:Transcript_10159/g.13217  ORF Transcript_10159/g.13217 Transcript_10159/m.13217 type:complete len:89 (-) Transcript_10159:148-414(-)
MQRKLSVQLVVFCSSHTDLPSNNAMYIDFEYPSWDAFLLANDSMLQQPYYIPHSHCCIPTIKHPFLCLFSYFIQRKQDASYNVTMAGP